jgi:RNA polymerase sigma-70 factor (ECF subfamily)
MQNQRNAYAQRSDEVLVLMAQDGDKPAFAELIGRYYVGSEKLAYSILRHRQDAEDEVQNACWKAFEHIGQFQRDAKFSTWLTRIVVNQCLMRLRQLRRARLTYMEDAVAAAEEGRPLEAVSAGPSPETRVAESQIAAVLESEIKRIPPLLRNVFILRDVQRLPMPEVAEQLGISVAAAKSRLLRARLELRNRLGKHQGRLGPATLLAS